ncbi:MAG: HEPN domain-containing protein [Deltaproteobacteria bacterium]|nr:HEPN domain-containing protein [Deltaproteobacteria bacterium]
MSIEKIRKEADRWFHTAEDDLDTAIVLKENSKFAHSCFHAQQAAEKAVKAIWYFEDADPWGHSVKKLIDDLEGVNLVVYNNLSKAIRLGTILDRFYIPTRYPNGLPDITPDMAFDEEDSNTCIKAAQEIIDIVRAHFDKSINASIKKDR